MFRCCIQVTWDMRTLVMFVPVWPECSITPDLTCVNCVFNLLTLVLVSCLWGRTRGPTVPLSRCCDWQLFCPITCLHVLSGQVWTDRSGGSMFVQMFNVFLMCFFCGGDGVMWRRWRGHVIAVWCGFKGHSTVFSGGQTDCHSFYSFSLCFLFAVNCIKDLNTCMKSWV